MISANIIPTYSVASHWTVYSEACRSAGIAPRGDNWRVARNIMVAPSDARRRTACSARRRSNNYFFTYMREVLSSVGLLIDPQAATRHARRRSAPPEAITAECVIHGSPKTVLDKLVAFRERVGPFGGLLMTGLDWAGHEPGLGARIDAAAGPRGDAEVPPARHGAGGGVELGLLRA